MEPGLLRLLRRRHFPLCKPPPTHKHMVSHIDKQTSVGKIPPTPHNSCNSSLFITAMLAAEHTHVQPRGPARVPLQLKRGFTRISRRLELQDYPPFVNESVRFLKQCFDGASAFPSLSLCFIKTQL